MAKDKSASANPNENGRGDADPPSTVPTEGAGETNPADQPASSDQAPTTEGGARQDLERMIQERERDIADLHKVVESLRRGAAVRKGKGPTAVLTLTRDVALGNGDRRAGTDLCVIACAEGVEVAEVLTLLRNPHAYEALTA